MSADAGKKNAHRCALVWFAISSPEIFGALTRGEYEGIEHLRLGIDRTAFKDISVLIRSKEIYLNNMIGVAELFSFLCSPRPCKFEDLDYPPLLWQIEKCFKPKKSKKTVQRRKPERQTAE